MTRPGPVIEAEIRISSLKGKQIIQKREENPSGFTLASDSGSGTPHEDSTWEFFLEERARIAAGIFGQCRETQSGCWEVTSGLMNAGYPVVKSKGQRFLAHRLIYIIFNGSIPDRIDVCHSCDNRACINPRHLSPGSRQNNLMDMAAKERGSGRKLTGVQVGEIRALWKLGARQKALGARFGVTPQAISLIVRGETWKHEINEANHAP